MIDHQPDDWKKPCRCTFAQKAVGDGCDLCNPELARELNEPDEDED